MATQVSNKSSGMQFNVKQCLTAVWSTLHSRTSTQRNACQSNV